MIIIPTKKLYSITYDPKKTRLSSEKDFVDKFYRFLKIMQSKKNRDYNLKLLGKGFKAIDYVLIEQNDFDNHLDYVNELQEREQNLKRNSIIQFSEFNKTLGYIFEQVKKAGVDCNNCKYCKTVLKDGKEQKMCTYYLQRFNLPMEEITNLCEHLEIKGVESDNV